MADRWITVRGRHILIKDGESVAKAINDRFGAKGRENRLTKSTIAKGEKVNYNDRQDIDDEQRQARRDYWQTREKAQAQAKKNYNTKIHGLKRKGKYFEYSYNGVEKRKASVTEVRNSKGEKYILLQHEGYDPEFIKDNRTIEQIRQHAIQSNKENNLGATIGEIKGAKLGGKYKLKQEIDKRRQISGKTTMKNIGEKKAKQYSEEYKQMANDMYVAGKMYEREGQKIKANEAFSREASLTRESNNFNRMSKNLYGVHEKNVYHAMKDRDIDNYSGYKRNREFESSLVQDVHDKISTISISNKYKMNNKIASKVVKPKKKK